MDCGIGLVSHVLNHRGADISATDFHPEAEAFMKVNMALNNKGRRVPFVQVDWCDLDVELRPFDIIIASDLFYERVWRLVSLILLRARQTKGMRY